MALTKGDYIRPARNEYSGAIPLRFAPEASSQSFKRGYPVIISSGKLTIAGADATAIIGFAAEDASGTASTSIGYVPVENVIFEGAVYSSSASANKIQDADMLDEWGLAASTSNSIWYIDKTESSASHQTATIVGFKDAVGTANGHVYFKINAKGRLID